MAVFSLWREDAARAPVDRLHRQLAAEAHIAPELSLAQTVDTPAGRWQVAAFACATHFYPAKAQVWHAPGQGACLMQGVAWRDEGSGARLIDAAGFAALIDHPAALPDEEVRGEYAVARLLPDGSLIAFTDRTGVHQLFHRPDRPHMIASRAAFLALLADDWTPDAEAGLWLATIGYRAGRASGWRGVRQLGQDEIVRDSAVVQLPSRALALVPERGMSEPLLADGIAQAKKAIQLAAGSGAVELPVTGGKDSRAVLALCLAAGLRDRLTLVTRGLPDHPDVVAARLIADTIGRPHRLDPPRADPAGDDAIEGFVAALETHVYQTDGGIGGWDLLVGDEPGTVTMLSGHLGEVLKGVAKQPLADGDPIAMVAAQAPFDPMGLLLPAAHVRLATALAAEVGEMQVTGAQTGDLADLFYWRNRVPNWLGGIRGVRAHEAQPIMPLGAPALLDLAFRLTPAERASGLIHFRIVQDCAPHLLALPFAHQQWSQALPGAPNVAPRVAPPDLPLFGNWQWRINRSPALRLWLWDLFAGLDIPLWGGLNRAALIGRLEKHRFDYRDGIALLGIVAAAFHQAGFVRPRKIGAPASGSSGRPVRVLTVAAPSVAVTGHIDTVSGAARRDGERIVLTARTGVIEIGGWAWAPSVPGAGVGIIATADGREVARGDAVRPRPDLRDAGIGNGAYGFTLKIDAATLSAATRLIIAQDASEIASFALVDESRSA